MADRDTDKLTSAHSTVKGVGCVTALIAATASGLVTGMADLKVSYDWLSQTASNLKAIENELKNTGDRQSEIKGALGSGDIAHAMDDFANNWDNHRRKILDKVQALGEMSEKTMEAFTDVDNKLKNGVEGHGKK
jgi:gas vesicle protein